MTSSEVVRTRHRIRRFLRRSLVLKIRPNTGHTLGTTDKRERRKNMAKSEGPNSDCNIEFLSRYENPIMEEKHGTFLPKSEKE